MDTFTHPTVAQALRDAGVEGEVRGLLLDARAAYQKKVSWDVMCLCRRNGLLLSVY
jgi:hypothetical protein